MLSKPSSVWYDRMMSSSKNGSGLVSERERIYIREASRLLNRRMGTLRKWDQTDVLPLHLRPHRGHGGSNWRFWTKEQIEGIKEWIRETERYSGKALTYYNPTEKDLDKAITKMRGRKHKPFEKV